MCFPSDPLQRPSPASLGRSDHPQNPTAPAVWSDENFRGRGTTASFPERGSEIVNAGFPFPAGQSPWVRLSQQPPPLFPGSSPRLLSVLFINRALTFLFTHLSSYRGIRGVSQSNQPPGSSWVRPSRLHLAGVYYVKSPRARALH